MFLVDVFNFPPPHPIVDRTNLGDYILRLTIRVTNISWWHQSFTCPFTSNFFPTSIGFCCNECHVICSPFFFGGEFFGGICGNHHRLLTCGDLLNLKTISVKEVAYRFDPEVRVLKNVPLEGSAGIKSMAIGSMGYFTYLQMRLNWDRGYNPLILTIDPNLLGHPSVSNFRPNRALGGFFWGAKTISDPTGGSRSRFL